MENKNFWTNAHGCIGQIAKYGLIEHNQMLIDQGYMDIAKDIMSTEADGYDLQHIFIAFGGFIETPGLLTLDELLNKDNVFDRTIKYPCNSISFLHKAFRIGSHEQRMKLIDGLLEKRSQTMFEKQKKRLLDMLKQVGDEDGYSKLDKYDAAKDLR